MLHRCSFCQSLSMDKLISLAKTVECDHRHFPDENFFQHHPSFEDLEDAALRGCDICNLVLSCFKGAPIVDDEIPLFWPKDWVDEENWDPEASMYTVTKYLPNSTVHFAIGASHAYTAAPFADVRQFDVLLVQAGDRVEDTNNGTMEWELPTLSLVMTTARDEAFFIDGFRIGRNDLVPDLAAPENFEIARQWLKSCFQEHDCCPANDPRVMPTRVVDVGVAPDFGDVKIASPQGAKGDYLTLSHCWGGKITPLLTQETVDPFSSSLPYGDLPANFKDAIRITRELGFRYVWIDSLCIIQDSQSDWAQESSKMAQIYRDSVLTISAICSSGSTKGILRNTEKKPLPPQPKPVVMTLSGSGSGHKVTIARDRKGEHLVTCDVSCPLGKRGWCLQESILSPRHLYYGLEQIYWRCPHGYQDAEGNSPGAHFPSGLSLKTVAAVLYGDVLKHKPPAGHAASSTSGETIQSTRNEYYNIAAAYTDCNLTFGSDKLPAFSGIARRLHHPAFSGGDYLAGIWAVDLPTGLSWTPEIQTARRAPGPYRAPTWSWAVTDDKIMFGSTREEDNDDSETGIPGVRPPPLSSLELLASDMRLCNPADPYGQICSGSSITVRGRVCTIRRSEQVLECRRWRPSSDGWTWRHSSLGGMRLDEEWSSGTELALFPNGDELLCVTVTDGESQGQGWEVDRDLIDEEKTWLVLILDSNIDGPDWDGGRVQTGSGLVLRRVGDTAASKGDEYQRVGTASFLPIKALGLEKWELKALKLI